MNYGMYAPNSGRVVNAKLKVLIADITLTNPGSFEMISIPSGFDDLDIAIIARSTQAVAAGTLYLFCNGDFTATNYSNQLLNAYSNTVSTARADLPVIGVITGATAAAYDYTPTRVWIPSINSTLIKNAQGFGGERQSATIQVFRMANWQWESTEPITSITLRTDNHPTNLLATGSRLQVFGLGTFAIALAR